MSSVIKDIGGKQKDFFSNLEIRIKANTKISEEKTLKIQEVY